jgi:inositol transport system substrate-binding protein
VEEQTGNWQRSQGIDLMSKWIAAGQKIDAVAANNDEMALGAAIALKQAGVPPTRTLVAGVDATQDGLSAMSRGELALTVFQDAGGQGKGAVKLAVQAMSGSKSLAVETWVPYQVVTPENYKQFLSK